MPIFSLYEQVFIFLFLQFSIIYCTCTVCKHIGKPIIYSDDMNVRLFGLEKLHPFDSAKFYHVHKILTQELPILQENDFTIPDSSNTTLVQELIMSVHSKEYLQTCLSSSICIAHVAEMAFFAKLPVWLLQRYLIWPMQVHVVATLAGAQMALEHGFAVVLGGGMHHAYNNQGGGWCFFDDVIIAARHVKCVQKRVNRIMIIDTDVHQGNGYARDVLSGLLNCNSMSHEYKETYILDMYNPYLYPNDEVAKRAINKTVHVHSSMSTEQYLNKLQRALDGVEFEPELIFYVSGMLLQSLIQTNLQGTDILHGDPLGRMYISDLGVIQRDKLVFQFASSKNASIVMTLAGGYQKTNSRVIAQSIIHLQTF